jgi:uncharacterized repeat protein (TIGR02543 family)
MGKERGSFRSAAKVGAFVAGLMLVLALPGIAFAANTATFSGATPTPGSSSAVSKPTISLVVYDKYGVSSTSQYAKVTLSDVKAVGGAFIVGPRVSRVFTRISGLSSFRLTYAVPSALSVGPHYVSVRITDLKGHISIYNWAFTVTAPLADTVTFNNEGGTPGSASAAAAYDTAFGANMPAAPTKTGYTFAGYNTAADGSGTAFTSATLVTANTTVYAQWTANTVNTDTVTFNNEGGTPSSASAAVAQGTAFGANMPAAPTKTGYTFVSYNTAADGSGTAFTSATLVTANTTVYAQWTINISNSGTSTITFFTSGGTPVTAITQNVGSAVSAPTAPTLAGYTFAGWYRDFGLTTAYTFSTMPAADITLYAKWTSGTYTVTFVSNGNTPATQTATASYNTTVSSLPAAPVLTGNTFTGWFTTLTGGTQFTNATPVTANTTVYAHWANNSSISFNSNGGTSVTALTGAPGSAVSTPTAPTMTGHTFGGWFDDNGTFATPSHFTTMPLSPITVSAMWTISTYKVTFDNQGGSPATSALSTSYDTTLASLPTSPTLTESTFGGWFTGVGGTGSRFTTQTIVYATTTVYAKWTGNTETVTFSNTTTDAASAQATTTYNTTLSKLPTAPVLTGNTFGGWWTGVGGTGSQFTTSSLVPTTTTVYALWTPNTYTVTFSNGSASVPSSSTSTTVYNTPLASLPTSPTLSGYAFAGWWTVLSGGGTQFIGSTPVTSTITVYANWTTP